MDSNGRNRSSPLPSTSTPPLTTLNTIPVSTSTSAFRRIPSLARPFRRNTDKDKEKGKEREKEKERIIEEEPTGNGASSSSTTSSPSHSRTLTFPSLSRVLGESSSSTSTISGPERQSQSNQANSTQPRTSSLPLSNSSPNHTPPLSPFPSKGSMKEAMVSALAPPVPILSSQNMDDMEPITYPSHLAQRLPPEAGPSSASSTPPPSTPGTGTTSVYSTPNPAPTWPRSSNRIRETNAITPRRDSDLERDRAPMTNLEYGPEPGPGGPPTGVPRRKESMSGSRSREQNALRATPNGENRDVSINGKFGKNSGTDTDSGGNDTGAVGRKRATTKSAVDNKRDPSTTASTITPLPLSGDKEKEKEKEKEGTGRTRKTSRPARTPTYITHPILPCAKSMSPVAASSMYFSLLPYHGRPPTQALRAHTGTLVGNRIWLIGGVDSKHCWRGVAWYDTESLLWSTVETAGETLPPLRAHTTTAVGTRLYIFGGGDGPTYSNDVWIFDTVNLRFSRPEIATSRSSLPPPRRAHTTVLYRNFLVIFGGGNGQTALNDVWALDISDPSRLTWEEWPTQGEAPARKGYHTANLVGDKMIVFGGSDGHASFADVHVLNLRTLVWTTVITDIKHNRLSHTSTQVGSYLFILGGHNGQSYAQDVLLFNLVTLQWESKIPKGQPPPGRGYHVALLHDARIFISGGYNGVSVFDDLWVLDLSAAAYLPQVTTFQVDETRAFNQDIPA